MKLSRMRKFVSVARALLKSRRRWLLTATWIGATLLWSATMAMPALAGKVVVRGEGGSPKPRLCALAIGLNDFNREVNVNDAFIAAWFKDLTGGQQTPVTRRPDAVPDFPLVVVP